MHHAYNRLGYVERPNADIEALQKHEIPVYTKDRRARSVTINVDVCDLRPQPPTKKGQKFILRPTHNASDFGAVHIASKVEKTKHEIVVTRGGQKTRYTDDMTVRVLTEDEDV